MSSIKSKAIEIDDPAFAEVKFEYKDENDNYLEGEECQETEHIKPTNSFQRKRRRLSKIEKLAVCEKFCEEEAEVSCPIPIETTIITESDEEQNITRSRIRSKSINSGDHSVNNKNISVKKPKPKDRGHRELNSLATLEDFNPNAEFIPDEEELLSLGSLSKHSSPSATHSRSSSFGGFPSPAIDDCGYGAETIQEAAAGICKFFGYPADLSKSPESVLNCMVFLVSVKAKIKSEIKRIGSILELNTLKVERYKEEAEQEVENCVSIRKKVMQLFSRFLKKFPADRKYTQMYVDEILLNYNTIFGTKTDTREMLKKLFCVVKFLKDKIHVLRNISGIA